MPAPTNRKDSWGKGANNLDKPDRLPEGFARNLVNLEPSEGGQLSIRADYAKVLDLGDTRLAIALADKIVFVDGGNVGFFSTETSEHGLIGTVSAAGAIAGIEHDGQVFISAEGGGVRSDGESVKRWGVRSPPFDLEVIDGAMPAGIYKVAVTAFGDDGEESGAEPIIARLAEGQALRVSTMDGRSVRVYCSVANGAMLYSQGPLIGGAMAITQVDDDRESLTTTGLIPLPDCTQLASYHSVIVGVSGRYVVFSSPMYPHLMQPESGFFVYPEEPSVIAATEGGVFVVADKTYFITGLETDAPSQVIVMNLRAVPGSVAYLPDKRVTWFTRYGQAIGSGDGMVALLNQKTYAPDLAEYGAAGVLESNGNSMVVTTMRGVTKENNLATGDFADLETGDEF